MNLSPFETAAVLIVLATILSYLNYRFVDLLLTVIYVVVVFSVAVQGTMVGLAARRLLRPEPTAIS